MQYLCVHAILTVCVCVFVCIAIKVFVGKLLATG